MTYGTADQSKQRSRVWVVGMISASLLAFASIAAHATAIVADQFNSNSLGTIDEGSSDRVDLGFTANYLTAQNGGSYNSAFVNNNGSVSFNGSLPFYGTGDINFTGLDIIAPYYANVDTSVAGDPVTYGTGQFNGRNAFGVNWLNVDYAENGTAHDERNSFQLLLVDRSDSGDGDFDLIYNYDQIEWGTIPFTDFSTGVPFPGVAEPQVGYADGNGAPGQGVYKFPGSGNGDALVDSGPASTSLIQNSLNSDIDGRYVFYGRNGQLLMSLPSNDVPAPAGAGFLFLGLIALVSAWRRRSARNPPSMATMS